MLIKAFETGRGGGFGPVEYVCAQNPFGRGLRNRPPDVLKGDPQMMRLQIDAVPFKWKYTSGVISFAKEDSPTESQLDELMENFEELAFAGLPLSSRSILWVKHEHAGRVELHFIIPRQEVHSGKSYNAFPPGWEKKYDLLRDTFNYKYGWARPDDPNRARPVQPGKDALIAADAQRLGKTPPPSIKEIVSTALIAGIEQGGIQNRTDILQALRDMGYELPRIGKDYITILDPTDSTRTRLKGTVFHEDFSAAQWLKHREAKENITDIPDLEKSAQAEAALRQAIEKTAIYNKQRYQVPETDAPVQTIHPVSEKTATETEKENHHGKTLYIPQAFRSSVQRKRARQGLISYGRPRDNYTPSKFSWQGWYGKGLPATLLLHDSRIDSSRRTSGTAEQKRNPGNATHSGRASAVFGAASEGGNVHGRCWNQTGSVPHPANSRVGTGFPHPGRASGWKSQTQRRYDESDSGRYQHTERSSGALRKQVHPAFKKIVEAASRAEEAITTLNSINMPILHSTNESLLARIISQVDAVAEQWCLHALAKTIHSAHWHKVFSASLEQFPALSKQSQSITIIAKVEQFAAMQLAEAVAHNYLHDTWAQLQTFHLPLEQSLPASWFEDVQCKAEIFCAQQIIQDVTETLRSAHWHAALDASTAHLSTLPSLSYVAPITAQVEQLAAHGLIQTFTEQAMYARWNALNIPAFPSTCYYSSSLAARCAEKTMQLSGQITARALGEVLTQQRWDALLQPTANSLWLPEKSDLHLLKLLPKITTQVSRLSALNTLRATGLTIKKQDDREIRLVHARKRLADRLFARWVKSVFQGELSLQQLGERCEEYPELEMEYFRFCQYLTDKDSGIQGVDTADAAEFFTATMG